MTTVGVAASEVWRLDALRFPNYNYHYQAFKGRQLCETYRARVTPPTPLFRRVDAGWSGRECAQRVRDNTADVISHWDRRNILPDGGTPHPALPALQPLDMARPVRLHGQEYLRWRRHTTPGVTTEARAHWNTFLSRCPERFDIDLPIDRESGQVQADGGYALRYLRPFLAIGGGLEQGNGSWTGGIVGPVTINPF